MAQYVEPLSGYSLLGRQQIISQVKTRTTGQRAEMAQNRFTINVVEIKTILADIKYLSKFCQVGNLGILHSVLNKYCPKRLHFTLEGLIARTQLAVLDYNCGSNNTQVTTKKGKRKYK